MPYNKTHYQFTDADKEGMQGAIQAALKSSQQGDYPIGANVSNGVSSFPGVNRVLTGHTPLGHAECEALALASYQLKSRYLTGYTLYTTFMPCAMCLTACHWAKVRTVIYGLEQEDFPLLREKHKVEGFNYRPCPVMSCEWPKLADYVTSVFRAKGMEIYQFMREECLEATLGAIAVHPIQAGNAKTDASATIPDVHL